MHPKKMMDKLIRIQEMEFVALELNLYLDTHPEDKDAVNDYNCAAENLEILKREYESECGPLFNFGFSENLCNDWQWIEGPWPWEL